MSNSSRSEPRTDPAVELGEATAPEPAEGSLARRLNLLLDAAEAEGRRITFNDIRDAMAAAGTPLSRSRWHYMRTGTGPEVKKTELLRNLARFFGVNEDYLIEDGDELPAKVEAQLQLLATMKANKVRNFAARQLNGLNAETLLQIRDIIDEQLAHGSEVSSDRP